LNDNDKDEKRNKETKKKNVMTRGNNGRDIEEEHEEISMGSEVK
jgi:hypothetical protein